MRFLRIYKFLRAKTRGNQPQDKQSQPQPQPQDKQPQPTESKSNAPPKPSARRVLITYGIFSLMFIALATAAWFFKGADLLPKHFPFGTNISNTDIKPKDDGKNTEAQKEHSDNKPEVKPIADEQRKPPDDKPEVKPIAEAQKEHSDNKPEVKPIADEQRKPPDDKPEVKPIAEAQRENPDDKPEVKPIVDPDLVNELQKKVERLKKEMRQLDNKLNTVRIKQYIGSAQYLIETRTAPEQALSLLEAARTDIEIHRRTSGAKVNAMSQEIDRQIVRLQQYIAHSPRRSLRLLNPLIDHLHTKVETKPKPQTQTHANANLTNESRIQEWLNKIYAAGRTLIKVEHPDYQYVENNHLLFKLLITARSAVLLNEQEQFNIALKDALRLIETMPNPPISEEQIQSILSLKISWHLPETQK